MYSLNLCLSWVVISRAGPDKLTFESMSTCILYIVKYLPFIPLFSEERIIFYKIIILFSLKLEKEQFIL